MSLGSISHVEMTAWSVGMGITLLPFERHALRALDTAYLVFSNSKGEK